ncbi:transposase, partial [Escherichia coli]
MLNYSFLACFSQYELHYSDAAYVTGFAPIFPD